MLLLLRILGLMMLEAIKGSIITLEVVGPDEKEAMSALLQLINHYFLRKSHEAFI